MSLSSRVEVGDHLQDWRGHNWTVVEVARDPSNAHLSLRAPDGVEKKIWENTMRARSSRWFRLERQIEHICLRITSFIGILAGADHYYCGMVDYDAEEDIVERVGCVLSNEDAERINKADGLVGKPGAYRAGDYCERFDTREAAVRAGVYEARRKHGVAVKVYLGNRARALEDMEELP